MKITVQIKLKARQSRLEKIEDLLSGQEYYMAYIVSAPIDGKANEEVIWLVSDYFNIRKDQTKIASWITSKIKVIEINSL